MSETLAAGRKGGGRSRQGSAATEDSVSAWFVREILPLEAFLMGYLHRNWRNASDIGDLRQEIYTRVFDAAREKIPDDARRFLTVTARNLLINMVKHEQIVSIESVADLDALEIPADTAGPDRVTAARDELRYLKAALDQLPPRTKEAVTLAYIEDLSVREIAARMGITKSTVSIHLANGIHALAELVQGEPVGRGRKP
jgi:RNA polymerase sigma factor (sigma-70 family)